MTKKTQYRAPPKRCTYCDERPATTLDHIPPKNLFIKPLPPRIVVPACQYCNNDRYGRVFDEQFRDLLSLRIGRNSKATNSFYNERIKSSMIKSSPIARIKKGHADGWTELADHGMFYRPQNVSIIDISCLDAMAERLARGFYRKEFNEILPMYVSITAGGFGKTGKWEAVIDSVEAFREFDYVTVINKAIGNSFRYATWRHNERKNDTLWLFDFYGEVILSAKTGWFSELLAQETGVMIDEYGLRTVGL